METDQPSPDFSGALDSERLRIRRHHLVGLLLDELIVVGPLIPTLIRTALRLQAWLQDNQALLNQWHSAVDAVLASEV